MPTDNATHDAIKIFSDAVNGCSMQHIYSRCLKKSNSTLQITDLNSDSLHVPLHTYDHIYVFGAGKASYNMTFELYALIPEFITSGQIITQRKETGHIGPIKVCRGSHPLPDTFTVKASREVVARSKIAGSNDLILFLLSGGASSLFCLPDDTVTLTEYCTVLDLLIKRGASIHEINIVRNALSQVKGGRYAALCHPAHVVSLIISDVPGDNIETIGSGPTVYTEYQPCKHILEQFHIDSMVSSSILSLVTSDTATDSSISSLSKQNVQNVLIASNKTILREAALSAQQLGYEVLINDEPLDCPLEQAVDFYIEDIDSLKNNGHKPICFLSGGETTVTVTGNGAGGRNQELCLRVLQKRPNLENIAFLSCGSDGIDGPTDAAGAVINEHSDTMAKDAMVSISDYIQNNDSYNFFKQIEGLVITGDTGTNVADLQIALYNPNFA